MHEKLQMHMYPYSHLYPHPPHSGRPHLMYRYCHGPRRLVWFLLGGLAATLWLKGREKERRAIEWPEERRNSWSFSNREARPTERESAERWRQERERIAQIGSQATDAVADVSEAALDSILTTVEMLKTRLAGSRAQRHNSEEKRKEDSPVDSDRN